jgi:nucleotide-binding universal stress UspA family protein
MITLSRILCPVDFSGHSRVALDYATAIAKWYGAEVRVLHAYLLSMTPVTAGAFAAGSAELPQSREDIDRDLASFVRTAAAAGVPSSTSLVVGAPARHILESAAQWPADMIVMGTHGASGFERLVLGSVTEKVLRKARCPVLVVTRDADAPSGAPVVFRRILCAMDFSPCSQRALSYALSLAAEAGGSLTLLHAIEAFAEEPLAKLPFDITEHRRTLERSALENLEKQLTPETRTWCDCSAVVRSGKAYQQILDTARERQVDLIVLGVRGRNPVDLALFGSTANHVVRSAPCPVLTVRS